MKLDTPKKDAPEFAHKERVLGKTEATKKSPKKKTLTTAIAADRQEKEGPSSVLPEPKLPFKSYCFIKLVQ